MANDQALRDHLVDLLKSGSAHADFEASVKGLAVDLRGKRPKGAPHSPWEILEHLRIAQSDILAYSRDPQHQSPKWPDAYWPETPAPPNDRAWAKSVRAFREDMDAFCAFIAAPATDLFATLGDSGHTVLREALLAADHNSYHLGQLVLTRKLLGAWK